MPGLDIDYGAVFHAVPSAMLVMTPDLVVVDANAAYLKVSGRAIADLVGRQVFDVFPDNPADPHMAGTTTLRASLERVLATGRWDTMALQRYDVESADGSGDFEERYWSLVNVPVLGPDGRVALIVNRVEEVTALVRQLGAHRPDEVRSGELTHQERMAADLFARAQELQDLNEQLREAHASEREVAVGLQRAMLPAVPPAYRSFVAVRYRPAARSMNVCGDWYDLIDLGDHGTDLGIAVAVGDVVGHGLEAAGVMGRLHSALNAAIRATGNPATALTTLALFALTVDGALATTAVQTVIDRAARRITYSCAGHPPPLLVQADGTLRLLDAATDPPLGAWPETTRRTEAVAAYAPGATLVLYTDGLVERRGEDIDSGLARLTESLTRHRALAPEPLADALLADLGAGDGADDDTALVVVRL
ncbi:PP2C family protein-serine/threonine phosphatase [Kitasatospora sp. NPDC057223]|uniref:PP2C family protein-serine/threonine phosphatase n=1 Tax=Kitasatospora sp. NPDC057223 TaxID=3346055 RepID=UPI0036381539